MDTCNNYILTPPPPRPRGNGLNKFKSTQYILSTAKGFEECSAEGGWVGKKSFTEFEPLYQLKKSLINKYLTEQGSVL